MKRFLARSDDSRRRGSTVAFVAISLFTLFACASLAVDVGYISALVAEAQNTADAAALAGGTAMQDELPFDALDRVDVILAMNQATQGYHSLDDQTVELGQWACDGSGFIPIALSDAGTANAVRVVARRNNVSLIFAAIFGHSSTDVSREAIAMVPRRCKGIWGLNTVTVPGNVETDSYDSTAGPYDPAASRSNGNLCSGGDITVAGSVVIDGDVMPGLDSQLVMNGGSAVITGATCPQGTDPNPPAIDFSDVEFDNDNGTIGLTDSGTNPMSGNTLSLASNESLTLAPGTYYFDAALFDSGSALTLTGATTIFVLGDFNISGKGTVNTTMDPADLTIMSGGSSVTMRGQSAFYGMIFAPNATIKLSGNAEYFGAIIGNDVTVAGSFQFHVDESLTISDFIPLGPPTLVK